MSALWSTQARRKTWRTRQANTSDFSIPQSGKSPPPLVEAREETDAEVAKATASASKQKRRLESVLKELDQGVLICNLDHKILLYNRRAMQILHVSGELGLGRSLFSVVSAAPFRHALERLTHRFEHDRHKRHREGLSQMVICATADGRHTLQGRVSLLLNEAESAPNGFTVTFEDVTRQLSDNVERDRLLQDALIELRQPAANLRATAEMLASHYDLAPEVRRSLEHMVAAESVALSERIEQLDTKAQDMLAGAWPMSDVYSASLFNSILRRNSSEALRLTCEFVGDPVWLYCDSVTIVELIELILRKIAETEGIKAFQLQATQQERKIYLDTFWHGSDILSISRINSWLDEPLDPDLGTLSVGDVLNRHKTDFWCTRSPDGRIRLRLPLAPARDHHDDAEEDTRQMIPERLEFYDFDLMDRTDLDSLEDTPLRDIDFVVFDTETTGLDPSGGDEMISIAGVRIVNGRIIKGERFDQFIHPGRRIPPSSTRIHHITDDMVADAPAVEAVLPRFHAFVGDAVLVAHNAAFDMKFLTMKQEAAGVRFDNPVLDTVLLAAHLQGQTSSLTLDALAEQFGIEIPPEVRHTALGDSLATAEVLLKLIDLLEASGIKTLHQAIEIEQKAVAIRRKQARY